MVAWHQRPSEPARASGCCEQLTARRVSGNFTQKPPRRRLRSHPLKEFGAMRLQTLSRNYALPSRDPRRFSWNRDRVLFLGHDLPSHAGPCPGRPRLRPGPAVESPHSSPVRLSECVAGNSPTKSVNKLPKPATSRPALALCRRWIGDDVVSYRAGRRDYTVCISPVCVSGKNPVTA